MLYLLMGEPRNVPNNVNALWISLELEIVEVRANFLKIIFWSKNSLFPSEKGLEAKKNNFLGV